MRIVKVNPTNNSSTSCWNDFHTIPYTPVRYFIVEEHLRGNDVLKSIHEKTFSSQYEADKYIMDYMFNLHKYYPYGQFDYCSKTINDFNGLKIHFIIYKADAEM